MPAIQRVSMAGLFKNGKWGLHYCVREVCRLERLRRDQWVFPSVSDMVLELTQYIRDIDMIIRVFREPFIKIMDEEVGGREQFLLVWHKIFCISAISLLDFILLCRLHIYISLYIDAYEYVLIYFSRFMMCLPTLWMCTNSL